LHLAAQRMAPLVGQRLAARSHAPHAPRGLAEGVDGHVLDSARAHGKHLLLMLDDGRCVHSHLRMTGSWHFYRAGEQWRRGRRGAWLALGAGGMTAVQFGGPVLELLDRGRLALHPVLSRLGPDLLDDDPRIADAVARARSRSPRGRPIGEVLLDQTVAAGIGNVVRCEALHALRLDPWAPLERLSDTTVAALFEQSRHLLQAGVRVGGALPRAVYGRRICPRCGAVVTRRAQGDEARTVHWCAACQSLQSD
jgi:endonuclease-8